jgi:hypothetical protein
MASLAAVGPQLPIPDTQVIELMDSANPRSFDALATLLLAPPERALPDGSWFTRELEYVSNLDPKQFGSLLEQAETQRVLRRILEVLQANLRGAPQENPIALMVESALAKENERLERALNSLNEIVNSFQRRGLPITIMKTLDHWPDTGSDLDLLVAADARVVREIFETDFHAVEQAQSWGDRLAHKYNFQIPGLPELVETHVGCLGQTGEHTSLAAGVLARRAPVTFEKYSLPVPSPEDKVVIATLQRMYRHYYIRLTDIVNIFELMARGSLDLDRLQAIAEPASVWEGVATLLAVVHQYALRYGATPVALPDNVQKATQFSAKRTYLGRTFVRVPVLPEAANLYLRQLAGNGFRHNLRAMMRLSLLPVLATAAFVSFRITGNDKGVW